MASMILIGTTPACAPTRTTTAAAFTRRREEHIPRARWRPDWSRNPAQIGLQRVWGAPGGRGCSLMQALPGPRAKRAGSLLLAHYNIAQCARSTANNRPPRWPEERPFLWPAMPKRHRASIGATVRWSRRAVFASTPGGVSMSAGKRAGASHGEASGKPRVLASGVATPTLL